MSEVCGYQRHFWRTGRLALVLGATFLVQGCANGMPHFSGPKPKPVEQVVVPEPAPSLTRTAVATSTRKAPPKVNRTASVVPARQDLTLNVLYYVRIMVPVGSELTVRANSAAGGAPSIKTIKTKGGPPYAMEIPVSAGADAYPMTIDATLNSSIGHVLTGAVTLDGKPTKPVEIVMVPTSE
ncbi:hypothetical protein G5B38_08955 [Pseudohalocynthiibacter aestuariivivens]|uniref:Lipoprotein n=1 Tax=Roseovarius pelagicus TaxID=2980108 RepID=A0ABY6DBQ6_9RHOB|nr:MULTISPECIES: hypothetical protein [Rhodobacterales]QIE45644.1 hypothetical protein G5B38_08955 [Pseudohalocynthiibacter aestuariivivens]UXX82438.1 hypothetical protein N7U68_15235 [Roseovarius pelagicus]